ncbi:hypothetical protein PPERSA_01028 [Pseudocohnilembus persalinus]|uniref:Uncharacterized protein n=1 Tax=Pseudocohnilembus persalinus TaxID=266149 RepID=A0A0V0QUQ5_PSEPJ|nr:hypothetical protein PPERSA_01028 [Pseudocohnilembus persalinus]|eukprot:KRX05950.1 hypothetical protein PPERSA_01028 [Pseudocohnilembus persalinus]
MLNPDPEMRITWKELYEILNDIFQSTQNETKGKEKKKTLSSSKSSQMLRDSKLSLESEMERSFQNSLKNQFYLFSQNDSYVYEVWEFDYIELFQAYQNQSSSNILKEESNDQAQFSYEVSLKDQGINCIKTFHNQKFLIFN